jgi:acyl-CoA thioester hydrolase
VSELFEHQVSIRWRDTDALGHVNNAVFLTYLEEGRDALYNQIVGDVIYVVVRIEIDFRSEVRSDDRRVTVQIGVERVGTKSLTTSETIFRPGGEIAAQARVVTVRWDPVSRSAAPFAAGERAGLEALALPRASL